MKKAKKILFYTGIIIPFIGIIALFISFFYIPTYLEKKVLPIIAEKLGISKLNVKVRNIDFFGANFDNITIGNEAKVAFSVQSLRVNYSLNHIIDNKINSVLLNGLKINANYANKTLSLPGYDYTQLFNKNTNIQSSKTNPAKKNFKIGEIIIKNSILILNHNSKKYRIPFDLNILPENSILKKFKVSLVIYPRGQKITLNTSLNLNDKNVEFNMHSDKFPLFLLDDFLTPVIQQAKIKGIIQFNAHSTFNIKNPSAAKFNTSFELLNFSFLKNNIKLHNSQNIPIKISIQGTKNNFAICANNFAIQEAFPIEVKDLQINVLNNEKYEVDGKFSTVLLEKNTILKENITNNIIFSGECNKENKWNFNLETKSSNNIITNLKNYDLSLKIPQININGTGHNFNNGEITTKLSILNLKIKKQKIAICADVININDIFKFNNNKFNIMSKIKGNNLTYNDSNVTTSLATCEIISNGNDIDFKHPVLDNSISMKNIEFASDNIVIKIPKLKCQTEWDCLSAIYANTLLSVEKMVLFEKNHNLKLDNINATIPIASDKPGFLIVNDIILNENSIGTLSTKIINKKKQLILDGTIKSSILNDMNINFSGGVGLNKEQKLFAEIAYNLPIYSFIKPFALDVLIPQIENIFFTGNIEMDGKIIYKNALKMSLNTNISNSSVNIKNENIKIDGIDLSIKFDDLINLKTLPKQIFSFKSIAIKDFEKITNGKMQFQLESPNSFFIEKSYVQWCDGNITVPVLRFNPNNLNKFNILLYCDNLSLERILETFDIAKGKSKGKLNGKIELLLEDGKMKFKDGFLHSTPGVPGVIKVDINSSIIESIPKNSPQFNTLDLTREALKKFIYDWIKLDFVKNNDDELIMKISLNGKPDRILPFTINKNNGSFVRSDIGARFESIVLNINVPLNKTMNIGYSLKDILNIVPAM